MQGLTTHALMVLIFESVSQTFLSVMTIWDIKLKAHLHSKLIHFLFLR